MLSNEHFQKLLYDLLCTWHKVQRHYDPPITDSDEVRTSKVKSMICKILTEVDARISNLKACTADECNQDLFEEWTMLTWNVLTITSRLQNCLLGQNRDWIPTANVQLTTEHRQTMSTEDRAIFSRLNQALIELVNYSSVAGEYRPLDRRDEATCELMSELSEVVRQLHRLYRHSQDVQTPEKVLEFRADIQQFGQQALCPLLERFKAYCNVNSVRLWQDVRGAQVARMAEFCEMIDEPVRALVSFYSHMTQSLAVLAARIQGFRYDLMINKKMFETDPLAPLSDAVFAALELLMTDCVLCVEPSSSAILVTNNLFAMNCGALARSIPFKDFEMQVVSEETAEHIQSELRRQKMLQQPSPIGVAPSAALLAMKPTSGTKRANAQAQQAAAQDQTSGASNGSGAASHKKSDVNSKESVVIYPIYHVKNRYWAANYPHLLCTTRQKSGTRQHSNNNSFQDLSPSAIALLDAKSSSGKRPIFYFHIRATLFSPSGMFATAHTLSLPFTIATRRNQDCQVQRMFNSYTATCFWLYGNRRLDDLMLRWHDGGMAWDQFKLLYMQHFRVHAGVQRSLVDADFELLQYKLQCMDCHSGEPTARRANGQQQVVTFKNMLCPHLRYECGNTNVRFSVWRGMLELLQIFQDNRNNVRVLWDSGLLLGFLEFDQVTQILNNYQSTLIMRLSFVTGGTICFTLRSAAHGASTEPIHLEPLDLKRLQAKCLRDYLRDIAAAEKIEYILNCNYQLVRISDVLSQFSDSADVESNLEGGSRNISSNVTHSGDVDAMQTIRFTAMRIAVVTCKVKPPSADAHLMEPPPRHYSPSASAISAALADQMAEQVLMQDDFHREIVQLVRFHGRTKQELLDALDSLPDYLFQSSSAASSIGRAPSSVDNGSAGTLRSSSKINGRSSEGGSLRQSYDANAMELDMSGVDSAVPTPVNEQRLMSPVNYSSPNRNPSAERFGQSINHKPTASDPSAAVPGIHTVLLKSEKGCRLVQ